MGGHSGGGISHADLTRLEESAKKKLTSAATDTSRHVFISFAYEDLNEVNLLRGQAKNDKTPLNFDDHSVKDAFDSTNADYIKRQIREKIDRASVTAVYLSEHSAKSQWVNWEIEESLKRGKGVIGVYKGDSPPKILPRALTENGCKSFKWGHETLPKAIEEASKNR